ncbi:bifunctional 2-polyprenyl-6-hydroxyphenol methylase/3-demethylubiquinol 3-O-methyltransferase UbiG [Marinobacter sp. 1_MG-2023]|uniref:class I SAM-dependent methyltransferase n=1 Tax=Marinobacter sp. 1_MG-2023 TaxID=3062627 RepID=UPI0026E45EAA|nr:class I SAM-dependent methyltransferase [Marinobacter sp. 1_MG-2023]MDO6825471.1 class I SAM-dependent methyltransferase [Marinobacter sp. 1_MG-2023]
MTDAVRPNPDVSTTTKEVSDFYERHPYPPPVDNLDRYDKRWTDERRRTDYHLFWPSQSYRDDFTILVAGCGTSQAAKYALRWPKARVTGIDVSANSIQHTEALKKKYKLNNLTVLKLPVEEAGKLSQQFDLIVSTGVLHHLPDPDSGLRSLRDVLLPHGAMQLMVYAPYGRAGVYLLQDYCRRLGIGTSSREIQDLATSLQALPPDHPLVPLLQHAPDFNDEAGIADALLHPQDRAYSVPEFLNFLSRADLKLGRWVRQAAYLPHCGALASSPHNALLERLPLAEQYAAIEDFRGTMVRHSAVVYSKDQARDQVVSFTGSGWLDAIPLKQPDTIAVEENLPPGSAAVLINRSHTYTDIYLPITQGQKALYDQIDGKQSIRLIIERIAGQTHNEVLHENVRRFFEQLWRYDQILLDNSKTSGC